MAFSIPLPRRTYSARQTSECASGRRVYTRRPALRSHPVVLQRRDRPPQSGRGGALCSNHANAAVSDLADEVKGSAAQAANQAGKAAERAAQTDDDATAAATDLAAGVKGGTAI